MLNDRVHMIFDVMQSFSTTTEKDVKKRNLLKKTKETTPTNSIPIYSNAVEFAVEEVEQVLNSTKNSVDLVVRRVLSVI